MDEIYQRYAQTVYRYLLSLTRDADLAEELTQETFYQAIRSIDRYNGSCKLSTWLCAIAKHALLNWRRKHPVQDEVAEADGLSASAEAEVMQKQGRMALIARMHELPEPGREVMYLRVFGGLSFAEIGEVHGKSENWARVTYYRMKEKLRKEVSE
jgi:RNA polymerase sigma-70 factor (ECF subfamily)